jgi:hypothetical protein
VGASGATWAWGAGALFSGIPSPPQATDNNATINANATTNHLLSFNVFSPVILIYLYYLLKSPSAETDGDEQ